MIDTDRSVSIACMRDWTPSVEIDTTAVCRPEMVHDFLTIARHQKSNWLPTHNCHEGQPLNFALDTSPANTSRQDRVEQAACHATMQHPNQGRSSSSDQINGNSVPPAAWVVGLDTLITLTARLSSADLVSNDTCLHHVL